LSGNDPTDIWVHSKFHHGGQSMSISAVSSGATNPVSLTKIAPDGDSPAVEAAESRATKIAEKQNGGFAPKATAATTASANAAIGKGTNIDKTA
jgi:hypothetical protein